MKHQAAVIGSPVMHSLSPKIFQFLFKKTGRTEIHYDAHEVTPEHLEQFLQILKSQTGWLGVNVTLPHKEKILPLVDQVSSAVKAIGAANVIEVKGQQLIAHNTDLVGISQTLHRAKVDTTGKSVLILGAGGAARAAAYACASGGAGKICVLNRTLARADSLINDFRLLFASTEWQSAAAIEDVVFSSGDLIIQSTPVGMTGYSAATDFYGELFKNVAPRTVAFELIYRPQETAFIKKAQAHGAQIVLGLDMLIGQALATWEIWLGPLVDKESLWTGLSEFLKLQLKAEL